MKSTLPHVLALCLASTAAHASSVPSFACRFTEPFISIDTYGGGARVQTPDGTIKASETAPQNSNDTALIFITLPDQRKYELTITNTSGSDGMSDFNFPFAGALKMSGDSANAQTGGCIKYPDGTTPRKVANIGTDDALNVRTGAGIKNPIVTKLRFGNDVWVFPENTVGRWARVAVAQYPANETGPIAIVEGWVNTRFLGPGVYAD